MSMSSDLTRKRKHSDVSAVSTANHRQRATPSAAVLPSARNRDDETATEIAHSSTIQVDNCTAQDQARVQYGNTYVQNQYNGLDPRPEQHSRNIAQRMDFVEALTFEEMNSRYKSIDPAHVNTCQWLFQKLKYIQWRDREHLESHNGFLWIKGKAGSGKSTLMKCAFAHAEENFPHDKIVSFFFNARGQHLERSVEGMYRSLLSQILRRFPQLRPKFPAYSPESVQQRGWAVTALRNYLHRAITNLSKDDAITLYIDALDECDEDDIREAIEHFEELGPAALSMPISLRICFASRYYPRVSIQRCIEIHVEEQIEHQQDIRNYINGKLTIRNVTFKAQLASEIEARASGVFFWVVLVVRLIKKRCDGGVSHVELSKSLQEVPNKLQELIGVVLDTPDDSLLCTLRWILFARLPLKIEELYFAIRTGTGRLTSGLWNRSEVDRDDMEALILASSRGLVEIKPFWFGKRAQLVHESVREYLITGGLEDLGPSNNIVAAKNHAELFQWCQTYLGSIEGEHVATFKKGDIQSPDEARQTYPLLDYAESYIFYHFKVAYIAGVLHSSSLHQFPIRQYVYLDFLNDKICPGVYQQLLEPHHLSTSLLYISIRRGYTQLAEALLAESAVHSSCVANRDCTSATPSNSTLPAAKIDLNFQFEEAFPSLLELAIGWCPDLVCPLLDHGADVNINGGAPLCTAVELCGRYPNKSDVVHLLLSRGAHAQVFKKPHGTYVLTLAVKTCSLAIIESLLEYGADANVANGSPAVSPLLAALGYKIPVGPYWVRRPVSTLGSIDVDTQLLRVLLNHGADLYLRAGPEQISPLQYAIEQFTHVYRGRDLIRLLTSHGQRNI
jgi:energy-coupling factor transporter ATP-binding protein EcfA2